MEPLGPVRPLYAVSHHRRHAGAAGGRYRRPFRSPEKHCAGQCHCGAGSAGHVPGSRNLAGLSLFRSDGRPRARFRRVPVGHHRHQPLVYPQKVSGAWFSFRFRRHRRLSDAPAHQHADFRTGLALCLGGAGLSSPDHGRCRSRFTHPQYAGGGRPVSGRTRIKGTV